MAHIEPTHIVEPKSVSASGFFSNGFYAIPLNQRYYRWGEDQWKDLWNDILTLCDTNFNGDTPISDDQRQAHFMGAIVQIKENRSDDSERGDIADGQQRVTTLSVLYAILLYYVETEVAERKTFLRNRISHCLYAVDSDGIKWRLRLSMEWEFFENTLGKYIDGISPESYWGTIQEFDRKPIAKRLMLACKYYESQVSEFIEQNGISSIEKLITIATEGLTFLKTTVFKKAVAYKLFETMNNRGLDLSQADLIKNKILERAEAESSHDDTVSNWNALQSEIEMQNLSQSSNSNDESKKLKEFIQLEFISRHDDVKLEDIYDRVVAHLNKEDVTASGYTNELLSECRALSRLKNAPTQSLKKAEEYIDELLETLSIDYSIPLLLASANRFRTDDIQLLRFIKATRDFCFRYYTIGNNSISSLQKMVGKHSRMLRNHSNAPDSVIASLKGESPDALFVTQFSQASFKAHKYGFYVFKQIEDHIAGGEGIGIFNQSPTQHLEHIFPKKPGEDWNHIPSDLANEYLYRIGNMVALEATINRHIKNKSFDFKNNNGTNLDYHNSRLTLPAEIENFLENGNWTCESIKLRQESLAQNYAVAVWSLV